MNPESGAAKYGHGMQWAHAQISQFASLGSLNTLLKRTHEEPVDQGYAVVVPETSNVKPGSLRYEC